MKPTSKAAFVAATALAAALSAPAHAENLVTWTFTGTIDQVTKGYAYDDWRLSHTSDPSSYIPLYSPEQRAAVDVQMAPFAAGQSFTAEVVVDLDTPYGPDGVASFPNAFKSYRLIVPGAGVDSINTSQVHQGVSITETSQGGGDTYYFYLPSGYDWMFQPGTVFGGSIFFSDPSGTQHLAPDLHTLAASFDPAKYDGFHGTAYVKEGSCGWDKCGTLGLNVLSASVSAVPEPATLSLITAGLAGLGMMTRRRRAHTA
ncbi:MAG: PEP-CTERM sorting domain-containing protein [Aquabacterium sp.]